MIGVKVAVCGVGFPDAVYESLMFSTSWLKMHKVDVAREAERPAH
jgi:hypothetical protein